MFTSRGVLNFPLPGSPSFQTGNLSVSESGKVTYARFNEICIADNNGEGVRLPVQRSVVHQVAFAVIEDVEVLVICANTGVQFWSKSGSSMLYFYASNSMANMEDDPGCFFKGIASTGRHICVGTSIGKVVVFANSGSAKTSSFDGSDVTMLSALVATATPVNAIAASSSLIAAGSDSGEILCFNPRSGFEASFKHGGWGSPVTSLGALDDVLVAGYESGHIRIFRTDIFEMAFELTAHIRPVMGIAVNSKHQIFASCSEDQTVQVWDLPNFSSRSTSNCNLLFSEKLPNKILTGIGFLPDDRVCVAIYDEDSLSVFRKE